MATRAVDSGYVAVQKVNTHRAKLKELAGYNALSASLGSFPFLAGTVLTLGVGSTVNGGLGVQKTLNGELDLAIEVIADALGVADA